MENKKETTIVFGSGDKKSIDKLHRALMLRLVPNKIVKDEEQNEYAMFVDKKNYVAACIMGEQYILNHNLCAVYLVEVIEPIKTSRELD